MKYKIILYAFVWLRCTTHLFGQAIFIDQLIQAGELLVFPHITDSSKYYYLPNKLSLGVTASGLPQFSFLRYVQNVKKNPVRNRLLKATEVELFTHS